MSRVVITNFIKQYAKAAQSSQAKTGVPASVTLAQAILESNIGRSGLTIRAKNFFGIKGIGPAGSVTMRTREVNSKGVTYYVNAAFAKYSTATESFIDHGEFFHRYKRYAAALKVAADPFAFTAAIQKAGYATDPLYTQSVTKLIRQYDLTRFDKA